MDARRSCLAGGPDLETERRDGERSFLPADLGEAAVRRVAGSPCEPDWRDPAGWPVQRALLDERPLEHRDNKCIQVAARRREKRAAFQRLGAGDRTVITASHRRVSFTDRIASPRRGRAKEPAAARRK